MEMSEHIENRGNRPPSNPDCTNCGQRTSVNFFADTSMNPLATSA